MARLTASTHIEAPPERVFAIASDFAGAADTIEGISKIEMLTDGPVGVGTKFRETRVMMKKEATEEMEVTEFDPPRSYLLEAESCGTHYRTRFTFTPDGDGTKVDFDFEGKPLSFGAKILGGVMSLLMGGMLKKMLLKDLADVKAKAEQLPPRGASTGGDAQSA